MERLNNCLVKIVTFHDETNGYTVLKCKQNSSDNLVTIVGHMPRPRIDTTFNFTGEWVTNPKYGRQFAFDGFNEVFPATEDSIEKYLASGLIKGIGPEMARRIVDKFGVDAINIINQDINKLLEVSGIGPAKLAQIKDYWYEYKEIQNIMLFLKGHDLSTALAMKIYNRYEDQSIDVLKKNPYKLIEIEGVGFKTADCAAAKMGFGKENPSRILSGIIYTLKKLASDEGHCFAYRDQLITKAAELLEIQASLIMSHLYKMSDDEFIEVDNDAYYLPEIYKSEVNSAVKLIKLLNYGHNDKYTANKVRKSIDCKINVNGEFVKFTDEQIEAITQAMNNRVFVITGGPGTGKTTAVRAIMKLYEDSGRRVLLAAPTGRAAKRLQEVTGHDAKTIHRMIGIKFHGETEHNEFNPLEASVLIVDECSMIDIYLLNIMLKAVPREMKLILIGDVDQLPSVGPGKILADMIDSGVIPYAKLNQIQRQAQDSKIILNAHRINEGIMPSLNESSESDFVFSAIDDQEIAASRILKFCRDNMPPDNRESWSDVQVLSPMRKGVIGVLNLNKLIQDEINPCPHTGDNFLDPFIKRGETEYRLNDKVMQIHNDYNKAIYNGDIGIITNIDKLNNTLTVSFDDFRNVKYEYTELEDLVLAYAITIHKSQGCEYKKVIIPLMMYQYIMLQRNLLYTGVTRAKESLTLLGEEKAVYIAVKNNKISQRNTRLADRLRVNAKFID